ncbi:mechanosensitive ion channel family protein [Daeguia caeni]|uniref:Mechanosensitive ion channel family protein n=1 Tax=Daeguia caeni TaxID=439612 RepID=A0ABV9H8L0_9HYPH
MAFIYWLNSTLAVVFAILALTLWILMRREQKWSHSIIAHLTYIAAMLALIFVLRQTAQHIVSDYKLTDIDPDWIDTTSAFLMVWVTTLQIFQLINRITHSGINRGNDPTSARMIARVLKLVIIVIIVILFGEHFGIGLSGLLAFGGIGGIAIGVAGKDVLSNLFSGVMLYFDRPFNIGDWIRSPDREIEGTVVEIGWRLTKIKTFDNRPLYVPNAVFSTISLENPGRMSNRRISTTIGLRYEDADKIAAVIHDIRSMLKADDRIDHKQDLLIYFNEFADSSLNIMIYCFTKTTRWAEWLSIQQDIYLKIITIVHAHGADFAYPTQTLYMQKPEPEAQA